MYYVTTHIFLLLQHREKTEVQLSLNDWLDGIQKTVNNSIQEDQESVGMSG